MKDYKYDSEIGENYLQHFGSKYFLNLKVRFDENVLEEACSYFPAEGANKYPGAIRRLFGGKRIFAVYFSNANTLKFPNSINILLSSDVENEENAKIFSDIKGNTLSLFGINNDNYFLITKVNTIPKIIGTSSNRSIRADVIFHSNNVDGIFGLPFNIVNEIRKLPESKSEVEKINERIEHWDEYLKINERIAKDSQVKAEYNGYKYCDNANQVILFISDGFINDKHKNSNIQLIVKEKKEYGEVYYEGPYIGDVNRYNTKTNELLIDLNYDYNELLLAKKVELPQKSKLFLSKFGELVQIKRLRNGLTAFVKGKAENRNLDKFIFDPHQTIGLKYNRTKLVKTDLLQDNLNFEQIKAVEGSINCNDLFLIQGPPGTGKTTVIAEICFQNAIRNLKTLIASQTNLAVDNALSKLVHHPRIRALRKGNESSVQEEGISFLEDNVIETWLNKTANECRKRFREIKDNLESVKYSESQLLEVQDTYINYNDRTSRIFERKLQIEKLHAKIQEFEWLILFLKTNYYRYINDIQGESYKLICDKSEKLTEDFINLVNLIHEKTIYKEQQLTTHKKVIVYLNDEFSSLEKCINSLKDFIKKTKMYQELKECNKIIYMSVDIPVAELKGEAFMIKNKVDELIKNKPLKIFLFLGLKKSWLISACNTLEDYANLKDRIEAKIYQEYKIIEAIEADNTISNMLSKLKESYNDIVLNCNSKIYKLNAEITTLENKTALDYSEIKKLKEKIESFNKSLPYNVKTDEIDVVCKEEDIGKYYLSLWEQNKENDKKYLVFINDWIKRIEENDEEDYGSLKQTYIDNANVIGITCNQSGSIEFTNQYPIFDVAIIDEVSKATPPEIILSVLKAKRIILVGDHKQLPPMFGMETYDEVAKKYNLLGKETEHMKYSLFEQLYNNAPDELRVMLSTQYRMHSQIMKTINQFYSDQNEIGLVCGISNPDEERRHNCHGKSIKENNHVIWVDMPLDFINREEMSLNNYSYSNVEEVKCIKNILLTISANLYNNGCKEDKRVGIISFYSNQVNMLENELQNKSFKDKVKNLKLRIGSVDRFQGIECPIIICSFVRNNAKGEIGFAKDPRRINVALSRAQQLLIIVGCSELFCSNNKSSNASKIYTTVYNTIAEYGGIRCDLDFQ